MGIRFYAYPIAAADYAEALADPCLFHGADPFMDAWGRDDAPEMLYLDKCWRDLQTLFGPRTRRPARPAYMLVEGQVTHHDMGWTPYERALSPAEVKNVAADLATVDEGDIRRWLSRSPSAIASPEDEFAYIAHYLARAKEFTARLAGDGRGLVYLIG